MSNDFLVERGGLITFLFLLIKNHAIIFQSFFIPVFIYQNFIRITPDSMSLLEHIRVQKSAVCKTAKLSAKGKRGYTGRGGEERRGENIGNGSCLILFL